MCCSGSAKTKARGRRDCWDAIGGGKNQCVFIHNFLFSCTQTAITVFNWNSSNKNMQPNHRQLLLFQHNRETIIVRTHFSPFCKSTRLFLSFYFFFLLIWQHSTLFWLPVESLTVLGCRGPVVPGWNVWHPNHVTSPPRLLSNRGWSTSAGLKPTNSRSSFILKSQHPR